MDSLRIRQAAPEDATALGSLLDQLGYPTNVAEIPRRLDNLHARPGTVVLVAEGDNGDVLGVVTVHLTSALHRESAHEFYKARDYEHTGVRLTKVFVNRSGAPRRGKSRSSRTGVVDDARNQSRG